MPGSSTVRMRVLSSAFQDPERLAFRIAGPGLGRRVTLYTHNRSLANFADHRRVGAHDSLYRQRHGNNIGNDRGCCHMISGGGGYILSGRSGVVQALTQQDHPLTSFGPLT